MTNDSTGGRGRLLLLNLSGGRVLSLNPVGSDARVIAIGCQDPDGIPIDAAAGSRNSWTRRRLRDFGSASREAVRPQSQ